MGSAGLLSLQNAHSESYVDDLEFSMDIRTLHRTSSLLLTNFFYLFTGGLSTTAMVKIQLLDINDNMPIFTVKDYNVSLNEGRISSEPIIAVSATDADSGRIGTVTYRIINGNDNDIFRIDRATGEILVTKPALVSNNAKFDLEVSATDGGGLSAPQGAMVHVAVMPAGLGAAMFDKPRYNFHVKEDVRVGTVVGNLKATLGERGESFLYNFFSFAYRLIHSKQEGISPLFRSLFD